MPPTTGPSSRPLWNPSPQRRTLCRLIGRKGSRPMLKDSEAFSGYSVDDLEKAQAFYGGTLGIETSMEREGLALRIPGRRPVFVYPKPNHEPASFTVLNFPVPDIDAAVDKMTAAGIAF